MNMKEGEQIRRRRKVGGERRNGHRSRGEHDVKKSYNDQPEA